MTTNEQQKPPTRTQAILKLEEVPAEKWHQMVARTLTGAFFIILGLAAFAMLWIVFDRTKDLSLVLLCVGIAFVSFGWKTVSGQIVDSALLSLREPLRVLREFWKGPNQ